MEKRTILAIILCLAVWLIWQALFLKEPEERHVDENAEVVQRTGVVTENGKPKEQAPPAQERTEEKIAVLETPSYRAELTTRGASLKSIILKGYKARDENRGLLDEAEDLVSTRLEELLPYRISIRADNSTLSIPTFSDWEILNRDDEHVEFRLATVGSRNIEIVKSFRKSVEPYRIELSVSIANGEQESLEGQLVLEMWGEVSKYVSSGCFSPPAAPRTAVCLVSDHLLRSENKPSQFNGQPDVSWTGVDEQYFLMAAVPVEVEQAACTVESTEENVHATLIMPKESISPGGRVQYSYLLYLGPKKVEILSGVKGGAGKKGEKADLEKAVDFGWLGILCHPMLWALKIFYGWTNNYGVAIIILTIIIKFLLQPLTSRSMKSMREMAKLKPLMDELKEKYKDDKEKLNQEMMNLYKVHKINPLGGCFPMLLQMPIWIALYRMLYSAVELYQTPFIKGWIDDLSWRDPIYIMPVTLGVAMFLQQKLSPSPADSQQAKIMLYAMPVFFTFIMLYLPAGLVLYILVSSILSIAQQIIFNRKSKQAAVTAKA